MQFNRKKKYIYSWYFILQKKILFTILSCVFFNITNCYAHDTSGCNDYILCKSLAEEGDAESQYRLAIMYDLGRAVKADAKQALYWYEKSANQSHKLAEFRMGEYYMLGLEVKQNYKLAEKWYQLSSKHGHKKSEVRLWQLAKLGHIPYQSSKQNLAGTGFFIDSQHIITNYHVVHSCSLIKIVNDTIVSEGSLLTEDEYNDISVIKTPNKSSSYLAFRSAPYIKEGEDVLSVSKLDKNTNLKFNKVIHPNLEVKERIKNKVKVTKKIKLTQAAEAGDSGGPIIDYSGNVIGVNSAGVEIWDC